MYNSILKKVSRVTAYVAGGILIFLGVMGALVELSGGNSSFTHLFGYLVAAVLVACGVLICVSVRRFAERANDGVRLVTAYIAGGTLILLGIIVSLAEFSKAKPFATHFLGHMLAAVLVAYGVLTCVMGWAKYGGGLWSFFGLLFVGAATLGCAFGAQAYMQHRELVSPGVFFSWIAALWGVGFYCLFWGHIRRHKEKQN